ncbi:hypothetical protein COU37_00250 [Candidatus Micrarchaeota archaeon CG10_big_fil_rev_8_21_14_0_10_45_29]|nr:MAG: hypothetical protein COU37_00250 [Candidatus Micrarchaeota archaeon CG10_big_fil_rev_8_21_14_0_10_45_29]
MEYLMTYGWALLVIAIVVAVLWVIWPGGAIDSCLFQDPGFTCEGHRITSGDILYAKITNGNHKTIKNVQVACIKGSARPDKTRYVPLASTTLPNGESFNTGTGVGTTDGAIKCVNSDGTSLDLQLGESFNGRLYIMFNYADDDSDIPGKVAVANVLGTVQEGK